MLASKYTFVYSYGNEINKENYENKESQYG